MAKKFLSGDEAFAYGVRLARPAVISAYPIIRRCGIGSGIIY